MKRIQLESMAVLAGVALMLPTLATAQKIVVNEINRTPGSISSASATPFDEYVEFLLLEDLSAAELETYYVGDSQAARNTKLSSERFQNMSEIADVFRAGTLIVFTGAQGPAEDLEYDPENGDWNLTLHSNSHHMLRIRAGYDFAANDVAWVDTNDAIIDGASAISADGFGLAYNALSGSLGATCNVAFPGPANTTESSSGLTGPLSAILDSESWTRNMDPTPGQPNLGPQINPEATDNIIDILNLRDFDRDGIPDYLEDGAPNDGDGNNDGIPDRLQDNVASFPGLDGTYVTLVAPEGTVLSNVSVSPAPMIPYPDGIQSFPLGIISFELEVAEPGDSVVVTLQLSGPPSNPIVAIFKLDDDEFLDPSAYTDFDEENLLVTLRLQDGGDGDTDGVANGIIVDPIALGSDSDVLLIELESFTATAAHADAPVHIAWSTASEIDSVGFNVRRAHIEDGKLAPGGLVNDSLIPAAGSNGSGASYALVDPVAVGDGARAYFLVEIDANGTRTPYGPFRATVGGSPSDVSEWPRY